MENSYTKDYNYCTDFKIDCVRGYVQDEYCLTKCINKEQEYEDI
jgi:hypothetical protein